MSNLGFYQKITSISKKVGGPKVLLGITAMAGFIIGRSGEAGIKKIIKGITRNRNSTGVGFNYKDMVFTVTKNRKDSSGLIFSIGEQYRILECDGDAYLIEKLGDTNNPYFISIDFLKTISDINKGG